MKIAFDVDDTLIIPAVALKDEPHPYIGMYGAVPNYEVINIYKWFQAQGCEMIIWSGGGEDYAKIWGEKLGLAPFTVMKKERISICSTHGNEEGDKGCSRCYNVDIAFDDCDVALAKINVKVKRPKHEEISTKM